MIIIVTHITYYIIKTFACSLITSFENCPVLNLIFYSILFQSSYNEQMQQREKHNSVLNEIEVFILIRRKPLFGVKIEMHLIKSILNRFQRTITWDMVKKTIGSVRKPKKCKRIRLTLCKNVKTDLTIRQTCINYQNRKKVCLKLHVML